MHRHTLTFEGLVPTDEAERAEIFASPKVKAATQALLDALAEAGHPHTASHKIVKPKATSPTPPAPGAVAGTPGALEGNLIGETTRAAGRRASAE